jgi:hypothetical protein
MPFDAPPLRADAPGLAARIGRALDALTPCFEAALRDDAVSAEHALHLVIMDPALPRERAPFEAAILAERSVGDSARWQADYAQYARAKARLAWREGVDGRTLVDDAPARLRAGDLLVEGAVCRHGWIVAASGAQPWYDAAFAAMTIELVHANLRDAVARARASGGIW